MSVLHPTFEKIVAQFAPPPRDQRQRQMARLYADQNVRDEAVRQLRIWNGAIPDTIKDAWGDIPDALILFITQAVADRIESRMAGDAAEVGERLLRHLADAVMTDAGNRL